MDTEILDYEVVWNGGPLLPPRDQHPDHTWIAPRDSVLKRKYKEAAREQQETKNVRSPNR